MSGIFGIIRQLGATVTETELERMVDALKHRGPDGIHYTAKDNAGLGHCMLHSTPEALHEQLPYRHEVAGLTITADARIDNRDELIPKLGVRERGGQVITDSRLILNAFIKWGENCVDHLRGDFAFAIWDEKAQSLFVARDHMGCKPFYYHCGEGLFVFASSSMAIAGVAGVDALLNEGRVLDYLVEYLEGINKTCTFYHDVLRLPSAHCGNFHKGVITCRQYWSLGPADLSHLKTDEDYLEAFVDVYAKAVRSRIRSHTAPASMLSGGLDSSTVVALARETLGLENGPQLRTYSAVSMPGKDCAETKSVEAILDQGNLEARLLRPIDAANSSAAILSALDHMEDPFDGTWTLLAMMFLSASEDGVRSMLSGLEGDLALGAPTGYITYLVQQGAWQEAWKEAHGYSQRFYRGYYSGPSIFWQALRSAYVPNILRWGRRKVNLLSRDKKIVADRLIRPGFARKADMASRMLEYERSMPAPGSDLQSWYRQTMQVPYLTVAVERYERLASYFGVEVRHPLLDIELQKFSSALPLKYKVRDGWTKFLMRLLANERLPHSVAWREGKDSLGWSFSEPVARGFGVNPGFPVESMKTVLASCLDIEGMDMALKEGVFGDNDFKLEESWHRYILYRWLTQSGLSPTA